jgi:hypothetical protein
LEQGTVIESYQTAKVTFHSVLSHFPENMIFLPVIHHPDTGFVRLRGVFIGFIKVFICCVYQITLLGLTATAIFPPFPVYSILPEKLSSTHGVVVVLFHTAIKTLPEPLLQTQDTFILLPDIYWL